MSYKEGKMENQTTETVINVTNLPTLQELERQYLELVLGRTSGNKAQAAKILGVSIKTVYNKLDAYKAQEADTAKEPS